jgi:hypothetical protein
MVKVVLAEVVEPKALVVPEVWLQEANLLLAAKVALIGTD